MASDIARADTRHLARSAPDRMRDLARSSTRVLSGARLRTSTVNSEGRQNLMMLAATILGAAHRGNIDAAGILRRSDTMEQERSAVVWKNETGRCCPRRLITTAIHPLALSTDDEQLEPLHSPPGIVDSHVRACSRSDRVLAMA